jgi:hypothetical protein
MNLAARVSIHELAVTPSDTVVPFDLDAEGFDDDWWGEVSPQSSRRYFRFEVAGCEVARAQVDEQSTDFGERLEGCGLQSIVKIEFFEVADMRRGEGIGRAAAELLSIQYAGDWMTLVSSDSGVFWLRIGWSPNVPTRGAHEVPDRFYFRL